MLATCSLIAVLLSAAPAAEADPTIAKAKAAFESAKSLYKKARYAEAIAKFEEAYALKPHPSIYFNIGKCHEQLGDTGKALRAYRDYLRLSPNAPDGDTVTEAIANMERRLREKGVQQLLIFTEPSSAQIVVDGKALGTSPASIELIAGNHQMLVKAIGFDTVEKSFVMQTDRVKEMTINLAKAAVSAPKEEVKSEVKSEVKDVPKADANLTPKPKPDAVVVVSDVAAPKKGRVFTWVAAGVAVAAAGTGTVFGVMNQDTRSKLANGDPSVSVGQHNMQGTVANASFIGAGVAAAAAVVLFFVEGS
jgi:tetratricopeptide (TPR) repeat protein